MSEKWNTDRLNAELDACPAIHFHGIKAVNVDQDELEVKLEMPLKPELERAPGTGQFHGGPVATLIDTAGDYAVAIAVGGGVPTINFRVDYLKPCTGPTLTAMAKVRRAGRTVSVADVNITNEAGALCAIGRGTYLSAVG
ncbi:MAG: PaaI family thioesterase [Pseudomonadota bacterium]